jgi:hypothetical protein
MPFDTPRVAIDLRQVSEFIVVHGDARSSEVLEPWPDGRYDLGDLGSRPGPDLCQLGDEPIAGRQHERIGQIIVSRHVVHEASDIPGDADTVRRDVGLRVARRVTADAVPPIHTTESLSGLRSR